MEVKSMAIRIRVYPNYGGYGGYGGFNRYGGYGNGILRTKLTANNRISNLRLQSERQQNALRLNYERALWSEKLKLVQLQTQLQYSNGGTVFPRFGGYGLGNAFLGSSMMPFGMTNPAFMGGMFL